MELRPYLPADRNGCLAIFDSNSPLFVPATERAGFEVFLGSPNGPYFVMQHDGEVVGCGGYAAEGEAGTARLVWGMIRSDLQRQGLGRFLLMYRLREIGKLNWVQLVLAEVPVVAGRFFEGQGFKAAGKRGDRVEFVKKLAVCS